VAWLVRGTTGPDDATPWRNVMGDVLYLGLAVGFFLLTWAFVTLCERV
jgi:hypothetical protein